MKSHFLVTTALEETWPCDQPTVFLGEWVKRFERRHIWQSMDAVVAKPFGMDSQERERNFDYVQILSKCLLEELSSSLNKFHDVQYSVRQWQIILGHWLTRYVSVAFNRYFTLKQALDEYDISGTTIMDFDSYCLATDNSLEFIWACNDDVWNHVFYSKVLGFLQFTKAELQRPRVELTKFTQAVTGASAKQGARNKLVGLAKRVLQLLSKKSDAFILSTYLPFKEEIKLQLSLGQCPQLWTSPELTNYEPDMVRRGFLLDPSNHDGFERFVRILLSEAIPSCYVEGFDNLSRVANSLHWPTRPKFIFTSNNFDLDEVFKLWVANKIADGAPFYVGQHGAGYGTHKFFQTKYSPERAASDKFLTWGWSDADTKSCPSFVFTTANRGRTSALCDGGLLLIEACPPHRLMQWDTDFEFGIYQEEQFRFVEALPSEIHQQLTVRLHGAYRHFQWSDAERWASRSPATKIDRGSTKIAKLMGQSRIIVHAYDSTGILEGLALNIPTLCFWHGGLDHLLPEALPYYQLLMDAGILLDSPDSAAKRVVEIWDDIEDWWAQIAIQEARKIFCDQYARVSKNPVSDLKKILHGSSV